MTAIGDSAFLTCSGLTEIAIPASVASIGKSAFYDCAQLARIIAGRGSCAEQYCAENGLPFVCRDSNEPNQ